MPDTMKQYQVCSRCVMDTSDTGITFDEAGVCNHCIEFDSVTRKLWYPDESGAAMLDAKLSQIKAAGSNREYDCVIGLSGGVDSSYLALKTSEWGLRPLVVHVDAGWNSELAISNIERIIKRCGFDLHTIVIDWEEMRDLQLAYLRSGISNQDVPQDHAFFANLYDFSSKYNIKYVLMGGNIATESIFPRSWHGSAMDSTNLLSIHRRYGERPLLTYRTISFWDMYIYYPFIKGLQILRPLNFMPYNKAAAVDELKEKTGWRDYGFKHGESRFTKLFQSYLLPTRFGYDKRRPHLSSLIVSGQLKRVDALRLLDEPLYDPVALQSDIVFFCKKMRISRAEFEDLIAGPRRHYSEFSNWDVRLNALRTISRLAKRIGIRHGVSY